ncbi:putative GTP pyrophosphokinase [Gracilibacillus ureilyticus]|uniref:Putative GTP pyrophosphokinase n=1 Tax=Gracilibacillus ureilyticus TaxID=531814 RepID=A0A1H9PHT0_9BACI|nr:GTP pyrophosphokinase family protein [Gracilibacillus ureilyticus]SER47697.1 putative GTP pyrophosphokinase [Gracilibacillus ureilyticus]
MKNQLANINIRQIKTELMRFMMAYEFALEEINTKINILQKEFEYVHEYNPIEHVKSRIKSPESIIKKVRKKGLPLNISSIQENIRDIAGIRITCSFVTDIYQIAKMLEKQKDITVMEKKDYIKRPKPNGYKSLHLIIQIPIFMSDRVENIYTEIQIRTIAMDFWASLEHKIYYKYNKEIPDHLKRELKDAAISANELDEKMERIHRDISQLKEADGEVVTMEEEYQFPADLLMPLLNDSYQKKE